MTSTREGEGVERIAGADDDELAAVEQVGDRRVRRRRMKAGVPQRIAGGRIVGDEVSRSVAAEEQIAGRREQTERATLAQRMAPADLAGSVVERLDVALAAARAGAGNTAAPVAFGPLVGVGQVLKRVRLRGADVEQTRLGAEARRRPVGRRTRRDQ